MRTWVRNGASAALVAAGACALCAGGMCADVPLTGRLLASAVRPGELPKAPQARAGRVMAVLGGALPGLPEQGLRGRGATAAPEGHRCKGPVLVLLAGSVLTLVAAAGALARGRARGG